MEHALQREWKHIVHSDDVKIAWASPNIYVITVNLEEISRKLIEKGPWFVKHDAFAIQSWPKECTLEEITTNKARFWIQIHGLPLGFLIASCARTIGEKIGKVIRVEDPALTGNRGFLRIRVEICTSNPLLMGFWLPRKNGERTWARFKYEGLKKFCHRCGRLGHTDLKDKPCRHSLYQ